MIGVLGACAAAVAVLMAATWLVSLAVHDASIVDIIWGLGFVVVAAVAGLVGDGDPARRLLVFVLVAIWGLRLSGYLAWRNLGHGEDYRYVAMRKRWGERFWIVSLVQVFALQGVLLVVVSLPVQLSAASGRQSSLPALAWVGGAVWALGLAFESIGDLQLARFKAQPGSAGQVMDQGLWRYTRHPNYFGDFCVWWGLYLVAAASILGRFSLLGPVVMSILLLRVSGVAMLEKTIGKRRAGYADYVARTSAFFPRPPKPSAAPAGVARRSS